MFSQWRQAVENFAAQPPRRSASVDEHGDPLEVTRSKTPDAQHKPSTSLGSTQLADAAVSNLRKSLSTQRNASPTRTASPAPARSPDVGRRPNLEDRLRAKFTIGEASPTPVGTPDPSARVSPAPQTEHTEQASAAALGISHPASPALKVAVDHPLSPTSTPLPDSPVVSPTEVVDVSLANAAPSLNAQPLPGGNSASTEAAAPISPPPLASSDPKVAQTPTGVTSQVTETPPLTPNLPTQSSASSEVAEAPSETTSEAPQSARSPFNESSPPDVSSSQSPSEHAHALTEGGAAQQESPPSDTFQHGVSDTSASVADESFTTAEAHDSDPTSESAVENMLHSPSHLQKDPMASPIPIISDTPSIDIHSPVPTSPVTLLSDTTATTPVQISPSARPTSRSPASTDVEALQQRLKLVEQRFSGESMKQFDSKLFAKDCTDVSTSFKRLQAEKRAIDSIIRELTPMEGLQDPDALRDYLQQTDQKLEVRSLDCM
jgi:hypothetical protein